MFIVVAYDISDDKRRNKVSKVMESFGDRVQYSLFECNMDDEEFAVMRRKLTSAIDVEKDLIRIYHLCAGCKTGTEIIGEGTISEDPGLIII